jgi:hypothetical protein
LEGEGWISGTAIGWPKDDVVWSSRILVKMAVNLSSFLVYLIHLNSIGYYRKLQEFLASLLGSI